MDTKVPVFLEKKSEISLSEFNEKLQSCGLSYVVPFEAIYVENEHQIPCFAFYMKSQSSEDLVNQIKIILGMEIGEIKFICAKSFMKINCGLAIYEKPIEETIASVREVIGGKGFSAYFVATIPKETRMFSFLEPQYLSFLEYNKQMQEITEWKEHLGDIFSKTDPAMNGFMELKYYKI